MAVQEGRDCRLLLDRLDELARLKRGDEMPRWLPHDNWGVALSKLASDAAAEIRELRGAQGTPRDVVSRCVADFIRRGGIDIQDVDEVGQRVVDSLRLMGHF